LKNSFHINGLQAVVDFFKEKIGKTLRKAVFLSPDSDSIPA
jgi:hypothetical protein